MTNAELIAELRKPGKVEMPVITADDVVYVYIQKSDLIETLNTLEPDAKAGWYVAVSFNGVRRLDVCCVL